MRCNQLSVGVSCSSSFTHKSCPEREGMVDDERLTWADAPAYMALHLAKHLPVEDIARLSCVCRAWRDSLAQGYVWKQLLERDFRGLGVVDGSEADFESQGKPGRLHHGPHGPEWRALYRDMRSGAHQETLALKQVACSSIDFPEESARNTLWPSHCFHERHKRRKSYECSCVRGGACYWSSAPSSDSASKEHLVYELVCPCVVTKISICSYHAWWQPPIPPTEEEPGGEPPTYPPERVRVSTAWGIHESDVELVLGEREWPTGLSARDPVELELDRPVACFGGFLRVDLIGKRQRQTVTDLDFYYTCINFVSVQVKDAYISCFRFFFK